MSDGNPFLRLAAWIGLLCLPLAMVAGCASAIADMRRHSDAAGSPESKTPDAQLPLLALPPSALGCEIAVQQRLTVRPAGRPAQQLDALLEVDAHVVRLAVLHLGQSMGTMTWDGLQWQVQLSPWWPAQLTPQQVLSDMQLALWPLQAVQQAVRPPWHVQASDTGRSLMLGDQERVVVRFVDVSTFEIVYPQAQWTLRIDSPGGPRLCPLARGGTP